MRRSKEIIMKKSIIINGNAKEVFDMDTFKCYASQKEAALALDCTPAAVSIALSQNRPVKGHLLVYTSDLPTQAQALEFNVRSQRAEHLTIKAKLSAAKLELAEAKREIEQLRAKLDAIRLALG